MDEAAVLLATIMMYARHPGTLNSPHWVMFTIPEDLLPEVERVLAASLESSVAPD